METVGDRLIHAAGRINGKEVNFVRDTGAEVTLVHEGLVDPQCILEGEQMTLYTAIGQPFVARVAEVDLNTPEFSGRTRV